MTTRQGSRRRRSTGRGRKVRTQWHQSLLGASLIANAVAFAQITPVAFSTGVEAIKIMRLLGNVSIRSSSPDDLAAVGVAVITGEAFDAAVVPDPVSDVSQSWYMWHGQVESREAYQFDIRTARVLRTGYFLVVAFQAAPANLGTIQIEWQSRGLWTQS